MLKVAVLDDYQKVTHKFANWDRLSEKIDLKIFNHYIKNDEDLIHLLSEFDVLCVMRERTKLKSEIIDKLPNLKLVVTSGMWNPSIDAEKIKTEWYCILWD